MEKLSHATENILDENVEKLAELFPEVVTEVREPDGSLRHTIDVEALKERVGDVAEGQRERYQFTWPGKRDAKQEAYRPIDKCLRPCPEESVNWDTTENLYIEGDNLDALKLLRNTYAGKNAGKIKMIYIDPPYNTGHDFIYDDDFARTKTDYDAESGDYDEDGGRLVANPESNGRFHSDWCSMMYPRLLLARDLLSDDGVLFVSCDDGEQGSLDRMLNEIFGNDCHLGALIHQRAKGGGQAKYIVKGHDYIHVCIKSTQSDVSLARKKIVQGRTYVVDGVLCIKNDDVVRKQFGKYDSGVDRRCFYEQLEQYKGIKKKQEIDYLLRQGKLFLEKNSEGMHTICEWIPVNSATSKIYSIIKVLSEEGKKDLEGLGVEGFSYPKPVELVYQLVEAATLTDKNVIILDFFSGSATTAHAVMKLNAEDGGNRKFIMVQLPEVCGPETEAAKAGYKNICEIGKERIRRAGKKIADEVEQSNRQLKLGEEPKKVPDIGFRVLKIDSSNFEDVSAEPAAYTQESLMGLADNLKPGRTAEDILFQVMLQFQIPLSVSIERKSINGSTVFSVDDGRLAACFDRDVSTDTIAEMAKMEPDYAVMRDASFAGDDAVSNFGELFKTYSPTTITRVV
ncbi:site-specific DNA-methyltransferase [Collinsella ihumii]|uniref:site-specific DNA-methyltransferase n=1 Tax=Collinsella ihumii TaxID=1720204 RepID=UPI00083514E5|nr:site-specific DNA-methyltransferase [Collinsella ihumii]